MRATHMIGEVAKWRGVIRRSSDCSHHQLPIDTRVCDTQIHQSCLRTRLHRFHRVCWQMVVVWDGPTEVPLLDGLRWDGRWVFFAGFTSISRSAKSVGRWKLWCVWRSEGRKLVTRAPPRGWFKYVLCPVSESGENNGECCYYVYNWIGGRGSRRVFGLGRERGASEGLLQTEVNNYSASFKIDT